MLLSVSAHSNSITQHYGSHINCRANLLVKLKFSFFAMGNAAGNNGKLGFKVVEVQPGSPGHQCGLMEMTDYILSVNGTFLHSMSRENIIKLVQVC